MKNLKNLLFMILAYISAPLLGAEAPPKPTPKNTQPSLLQQLPLELQAHIIRMLKYSKSLEEAANAIRALSQTSKHFYTLINDPRVMNNVLAILANHWTDGNRIEAAWALRTRGAQVWFDSEAAKKWFREYYPTHSFAINDDFLYALYGNRYRGLDDSTLSRKDHINSLLKLRLNLNNDLGMQALYAALYKNDLEFLKKFLDAGANPNSVRVVETMLEIAAWRHNIEAIRLLLDAGANPNPSRGGKTLIDELKKHMSLFPERATLFEPIIRMLESKKREREEEVLEASKKRKLEARQE